MAFRIYCFLCACFTSAISSSWRRPYKTMRISVSKAPAMASSVSISGWLLPFSQLDTACLVTCNSPARCSWDIFFCFLRFLIFFPMLLIMIPPGTLFYVLNIPQNAWYGHATIHCRTETPIILPLILLCKSLKHT